MHQAPQVEEQEKHGEIEQHKDRRRAHLVEHTRQRQGHGVELATQVEEQGEETEQAQPYDHPLPHGGQRQQHPHMPPHIGNAGQRKSQKKNHPHSFHLRLFKMRVQN